MAEPRPACYHVVLRHGDYRQRAGAPSARQPFALSAKGRDQAAAAASQVAALLVPLGRGWPVAVYSSRQLRAWQTAQILCRALADEAGQAGQAGWSNPPDIAQTSLLGERSLGSAANLTLDEIEAVLLADPRCAAPPEGWKSARDYRLPLEGAESLRDAGGRVARHLLATGRPGQVVLHVGHGASFRHGCAELGLMRPQEIAARSMFHATPLLLCHESNGKWRHLAGKWKQRAPREDSLD